MNDTVVYRHRKPCGEVFYVGIGCEQRPYSKWYRNRFWHNVVKKYPDYGVEIVAEGLSWFVACELEKYLIAYYGRRDLGTGTLVNLTDGGDGVKGIVVTQETRRKMSVANKGRVVTEETRQKIGAWQKGKPKSEESCQKMSAARQKLTFEQAQEIRRRYKNEKTSTYKLAPEYGVSYRTISRIINNKTYTKLT